MCNSKQERNVKPHWWRFDDEVRAGARRSPPAPGDISELYRPCHNITGGLSQSGDICCVSLTASQTLITQPSLKLYEGCF